MSALTILADVAKERSRQIDLGWTPEHDQRFGVHELVSHAREQINKDDPRTEDGYYSRERLIQAAALLLAAVERLDNAREDQ